MTYHPRHRRTSTLIATLLGTILLAACYPVAPPVDSNPDEKSTPVPTAKIVFVSDEEADSPTSTVPEVVEPGDVVEDPEVAPEVIVPEENPSGFTHPGVLVGAEQLSSARAHIANGDQPWASAFVRMRDSGGSSAIPGRKHYRFASLDYPPKPVREVRCWAGTGKAYAQAHPELGLTESGCKEQTDDAQAAYTHALMWYFTGNPAHAEKAIEIMNAWSSTLTEIKFDQPRTDKNQQIFANGLLQAAWTGQILPRAAEIIRYTYDGWAEADIARFESMLRDVIYPVIKDGWTGGANGLMSYAEAIMGMGVFTNDRAMFDSGVAMWRKNVKTIIYMPSDGQQPIPPHPMYGGAKTNSYWFSPSSYIAGLAGETGRDLSHTMLGLGAMSNGAATAGIQGVDLFGEEQDRIVRAYELHADWINQYLDEKSRLGGKEPAPSWRPSGWVNPNFFIGGTAYAAGWEVAFNHYTKVAGVKMLRTAQLIPRLRPSGPAMTLIWETVTHAA